jgi:hypothetical protein
VGGSTGRGVIDHRDAQRAIEAVWDELVSDGRAGLVTLLRLAQQRYVTDTVGDPFTLAPIVAVTFCGDHDVGQHDRPSYGASVGKAVREVVLAWLRGIAVAGWEHHQLRQRVRDRILSTDPESYDEFAVEADPWLACPDVWDLEYGRVAGEGALHVQGADARDAVGRDRRRLAPPHIVAEMTFRAAATGDRARLDALAAVADRLNANANAAVAGDPNPGDRIIIAQRWASMFRPEKCRPYRTADGFAALVR